MKSMNASAIERQLTVNYRRIATNILSALLLVLLGVWNLAGPGMWWDEGWTLSVARNWVALGHYGRLLDGQLSPPGLEAAFPVTSLVGLSFRLFGVGIWQGRLVGVIFLVASLALMLVLVGRLYNRSVAIGTVLLLLCTPMHPQIHPLIMGRQVLAEVPMFCYLLAGYVCFFIALDRSRWWMLLPAILCWGIGLVTKLQAVPFWTVSMLLPLMAALTGQHWKIARASAIGMVGALLASKGLLLIQQLVLQGHTLPVVPVQGLYDVTALVLLPFNRLFALRMILLVGLPTLFGLGYAAWRYLRLPKRWPELTSVEILRLALLGLAGSWFAWYTLLSVGVPRYLFPATFFGSPFVAALLYDITDQYNLQSTLGRAAMLFRKRINRQTVAAWLVIVPLAFMVPITLLTLNNYYFSNTNMAAQEVADFLNTQTPPNALIETYESELHFLLNRRYHYPPDQIHVDLARRSLTHQVITIDYDPLAANPDYLVVGRFALEDQLYQPVLASGAFREIHAYNGYVLYERVR
jgi:hypothetical protein